MLPVPKIFTSVQMQTVLTKTLASDGNQPLINTLEISKGSNYELTDILSSILKTVETQLQQNVLEGVQCALMESFLTARPGLYPSEKMTCSISVGDCVFLIREDEKSLVIKVFESSKWNGDISYLPGVRFKDVKRVMLIQYLELKRREAGSPNAVVDVSRFNFQDVNLTGISLLNVRFGPDDVSALNKAQIDMRGAMADNYLLQVLIDARQSVQGIVLQDQNLEGIDLSDVNLSGAICIGTSFKNAKLNGAIFTGAIFKGACLDGAYLKKTNFTGVSLQLCSLQSAFHCDTIVVAEKDRISYVQKVEKRLHFILTGVKTGDDIFYDLSVSNREYLFKQIFFELTEKNSLSSGETHLDGGPQSMVLDGKLDERLICASLTEFKSINGTQIKQHADEITARLFPGIYDDIHAESGNALTHSQVTEFSVAQKTLFHWARSAAYAILNFNNMMLSGDLIDMIKVVNLNKLTSIYVEGPPNGTRLTDDLMATCFSAVLPFAQRKFPLMTATEVNETREFFVSPHYKW